MLDEWFDASYYTHPMIIISLIFGCIYVSPKLREGLIDQENCMRNDAGLNSPFFPEDRENSFGMQP